MGVVVNPALGIVRAYVIVRSLNVRDIKRCKSQFGDMVDVYVNRTGPMRSETHVRSFLSKTMEVAVKDARRMLMVGAGTPALLLEDSAPGQLGDQ